MARVLNDKIKAGEWRNVKAYNVALANYQDISKIYEDVTRDIDSLKGTIDLVVASSVMSFIPAEDLPSTMKTLGDLLKSGGLLCHSDWAKSKDNTDGFTEEKADEMYAMGALKKVSFLLTSMKVGESCERQAYVGVAIKV